MPRIQPAERLGIRKSRVGALKLARLLLVKKSREKNWRRTELAARTKGNRI